MIGDVELFKIRNAKMMGLGPPVEDGSYWAAMEVERGWRVRSKGLDFIITQVDINNRFVTKFEETV